MCWCLSKEEQQLYLFTLFLLGKPASAIANTTTTVAATQEKQKSPACAPRNKTRGKKGKGKGKAKPEPPEETDPRKLEMNRWVRVGFMNKKLSLQFKRWEYSEGYDV